MGSRLASAWRRPALLASLALSVAGAHAVPPVELRAPDTEVNIALLEGPDFPGPGQDLYLQVYLNRVPTHYVMHVVRNEAGLHAWPENLGVIGVSLAGLPADRYLALDDLPDLYHDYDERHQRLYLDADPHRLNLARRDYNVARPPIWQADVSPGALLNYDLHATAENGGPRALAAVTALRAFGGAGVVESTGLSRAVERGDSQAYIRLDTAWIRSAQDDLRTLTVGDFISGSLHWTRPTRLGGVQLRRDFALQPGLITYPLPAFFGEAALPSQIELYVDGLRQYSGEVLPGPYRVDTRPFISGAGQAQVVLTDALGRATVYEFAYYNVPLLLQQGLSDYSLEVGSVRRDYGMESFRYRSAPAASGSLRYGVTDWLTLEGHAEGDDRLFAGGAGALLAVRSAGTVSAAWAQSAGSGDAGGGQLALGYNWTTAGFTFDYSLQRAFDDYRDIASREGRPPPRRAERVLLGLGFGGGSSLSLNYTRLDTIEDGRRRSAGISYSLRMLPAATLFASASREFDGDRGHNLFVGLSLALGGRLGAGMSANRSVGGAQRYAGHIRQGLPADGGTGWGVQAQRGDDIDYAQADVVHRADRIEVGGGVRSINSRESLFADARGAFVWMAAQPRSVFPARSVHDGFALVSTGVAGVPVMLENRRIGRTDAQGNYLLTGLGAYRPNRVSIDPLYLPPEIQFDDRSIAAVPAQRAGVRVDFGVREVHAALLILHDAAGEPLPLGSTVLHGGETAATVGHDGQAYMEDLRMHNQVTVRLPDGARCATSFVWPGNADGIPLVGPLVCEE